MLSSSLAQRILQRFPKNLEYCFAYGSGVKKQIGYDEKAQKNAMIDIIVCVDDAHKFHAENLRKNPKDYSWMKYLGKRIISEYQEYAACVYFNTLIPIDDNCTIKYGVIRTNDLCDDLNHWNHLYIAGRLHKPVQTLVTPTNCEITNGLNRNFESALHTALLLLPNRFTYYELFYTIADISYTGDFRTVLGESKSKVQNIVEAQLDAFLQLYSPHMQKFSDCLDVPDLHRISDKQIEQSKSNNVILTHLEALPSSFHDTILKMTDSLQNISRENKYADYVNTAISKTNWENSVGQSIKNIPTAGIIKSLRYSGRKLLKTFSK